MFTTLLFPIYQFSLAAPMARPETIEIGYNESITVEVGMGSLSPQKVGEWEDAGYLGMPFLKHRYVTFEAEFPDGNPGGWFVNFETPLINVKQGTPIATKATISLEAPPDSKNPIQNTAIRIKMTDYWVMENAIWPEGPDYRPGGEFWTPGIRVGWLFAGLLSGWYKWSGTVQPEYREIDILVKVKPYHAVTFEALEPEKIRPKGIISVPVIVENRGNYNDNFSFNITSTHENLKVIDPGSISLEPGEIGTTHVAVAAPPALLDSGTLHTIKIGTYSMEQPEVIIDEQLVFLETQGIYVSEIGLAYTAFYGFIIILGIIFIFHLRKRKFRKKVGKPEKPWTIPEEKKYLEELKKKDKKEFEKERLMMESEYKSAMLWYENYCDAIRQKEKEKKQREGIRINIIRTFKKLKQKETKQLKKEKKPVKIEKVELAQEKTQTQKIQEKSEEERKKEMVLLRIKQEQDKQNRKLRKRSFLSR